MLSMPGDHMNHPFTHLLILACFMITGFLITLSFGFILALPIFNLSFAEMSRLIISGEFTEHLYIIKYFQTVQTIGVFVIPPFFVARMYSHKIGEYLGFAIKPKYSSLFIVVVAILSSIPLIHFLSEVNQNIHMPESWKNFEEWLVNREEQARGLTFRLLEAPDLNQFFVNLVIIAVLPAIGEELVFRGILQKLFARWARNIHWGIVIASFLFSAMHFQFYGLIPRFALGILLGYLFFWSGSIWIPVAGHFVNNGSAVLYYFLMNSQQKPPAAFIETYETKGTIVVVSLLMVAMCCIVFYREERRYD